MILNNSIEIIKNRFYNVNQYHDNFENIIYGRNNFDTSSDIRQKGYAIRRLFSEIIPGLYMILTLVSLAFISLLLMIILIPVLGGLIETYKQEGLRYIGRLATVFVEKMLRRG